jgi:hypothetical protein
VGAVMPDDFIFGGVPQVSSCDFEGEYLQADLNWLYLAIVLLNV